MVRTLAVALALLIADAIFPTRSDDSILAHLSTAALLASKLLCYVTLVAHVLHYRMFTQAFDGLLIKLTTAIFLDRKHSTDTVENYLGYLASWLFPWHSLLVFLGLFVPMLSSAERALHYVLGAAFIFVTYDCGKVHTRDRHVLVLLNFHHLGAVVGFVYATEFRGDATSLGEMWHNMAFYSWLWLAHALGVITALYQAARSGLGWLLARLPFSRRASPPPPPTVAAPPPPPPLPSPPQTRSRSSPRRPRVLPPATKNPETPKKEKRERSIAMELLRYLYAGVSVLLFYLHFTDDGQPLLDGSTYQTYSVAMMVLGRLLTNDNWLGVPFIKHVEAPGYVLVTLWLLYRQQRFATAAATLACVATFVGWKCRPRTALPEPEPLPFDESASQLVLVPKDADPTNTSPACSALIFADAARLRRHEEALLTLASHPGKAVVPKNGVPLGPFNVGGNAWLVVGLGVGEASLAESMRCVLDAEGFLVRTHDERCFDVAWWRYEPFNDVNLVNEKYDKSKTKIGGGGRSFVCNEDGTISLRHAPHLVLGVKQDAHAEKEKSA